MNEIAKVRILIAEINSAEQIFTDAQIQLFLDIHNGNVHHAAASALRAIAVDEALLRDVKTDDISVTSSATARELRLVADKLDERADKMATIDNSEYFDIVNPYTGHGGDPELTFPGGWF